MSPGERVCAGRAQRLGQIDAAENRGRAVEPDRGSVFVQPGALVRYLPQEPDFSGFASTLAYVEAGLRPGRRPPRRALICWSNSASPDRKIRRIFPAARRAAPRWRGCWRRSPDILLLDEPTNHLDLTTIEWLERDLDSRRTALVIDQPRPALSVDAVAQHGLARPRRRRGGSSAALPISKNGATRSWRRRSAISTSSTARSSPRSIGCVTASPAGASATCAGSANCRRLREQRRSYRAAAGNATITAGSAAPSGALVIEAKGIGKSYDGRPIVRDFSIRIQRGDRIGIVGPNGSGKTTLINMLTGVLPPDTGTVRLGSTLADRDAQSASRQPRSQCHRRRGA